MQDDRDYEDQRGFTPDELADLSGRHRDAEPTPAVKSRTIDALRERGLLRDDRIPRRRFSPLLVAAASLVFAVGAACGYLLGARRAADTTHVASPTALPTAVAQADSIPAPPKTAKQVIWF